MSIDFESLNASLLTRARDLLPAWLPNGKWQGHEYHIGSVHGEAGKSLSINSRTGVWKDFAADEGGSDLVSLYAAIHSLGQRDAALELGGIDRPNGSYEGAARPAATKSEPTLESLSIGGLGAPSSTWNYCSAEGKLDFIVARYDPEGRDKEYRPWTWNGQAWITKAPASPRILYGLERLAGAPVATVVLCEGEKAADAAQTLLPNYACMTWSGGANAWSKSDFAPLKTRKVILWPDADEPGLKAAAGIEKALKEAGCNVVIAAVESDRSPGWDAADALEEMSAEEAKAWLLSVTPQPYRRPLQWPELDGKEPPPREWIIDHWLTHGPTLLAGRGGVGKTLLAQTLGTAMAMGVNYVDIIAKPGKVLFWACEDDHDELWRRQICVNRMMNVPMAGLHGKFIIEPRLGCDNGLFVPAYGIPAWTKLRTELREQLNDYAVDVLILDNIGQCFGGNENVRLHVTAFISGLMGLVERPISIILLGHPAKSTGSEYSGSTAWEAAVRMRWYLGAQLPDVKPKDEEDAPDDQCTRYLCKRKANYSRLDYRELRYENGAYHCVEAAQNGPTFQDKYGNQHRGEYCEEMIYAQIASHYGLGIRLTQGKSSPDYFCKKIREIRMAQDYTDKEMSAALANLRHRGRIIEGPIGGTYKNRAAKFGLIPSSAQTAQT